MIYGKSVVFRVLAEFQRVVTRDFQIIKLKDSLVTGKRECRHRDWERGEKNSCEKRHEFHVQE